jgi:hypothetical protein
MGTMGTLSTWPRGKTLATTQPGRWVEIQRFLFKSVENRCRAAGIRRGDVLRCVANRPQGVIMEDASGTLRSVERPYAWFVGTEGPLHQPEYQRLLDQEPAGSRALADPLGSSSHPGSGG